MKKARKVRRVKRVVRVTKKRSMLRKLKLISRKRLNKMFRILLHKL